MLKQLFRLANLLDREGFQIVADEVDDLIKSAIPRSDEEIDKSVEEYFADKGKQRRNRVEQALGLDEEGMYGLEPDEWHGFEYNFEGAPREQSANLKPLKRYHTILVHNDLDPEAPEKFVDPDGVWALEFTTEIPEAAGVGHLAYTYSFTSNKDLKAKEERAGDVAELQKMLAEPDDVETTEMPEDVVETEEVPKKQHGGGVNLF